LKEGDDREPSNYRGITLLSVVGKVFTQVLQTRLVGWVEKKRLLEQEQGGFRPGIGCTEQTFSLVELVKNRGREKDTFCCFIDIKKAFDRVFRAGLWQRLASLKIRGKLWRVVRCLYNKVESKVFGGDLWFELSAGVRQGCILSPLLYAIFIDGLVKHIK